MEPEIVQHINESLGVSIPPTTTMDELHAQLSAHINHLINTDFDKLVYYLYRIDVDEKKIRHLLSATSGENAAATIASLIIQRQLQKIESRKKNNPPPDIPDEEKW